MSFRHPDDYIRNAPYDDPTIILVLVVMGQSADADNGKLWPSVTTLAKRCRISERRMREIMNLLIEDGFVERRFRRTATNRNISNMYRMYLTEEAAERKAAGIPATPLDDPCDPSQYCDPSQGDTATHRRGSPATHRRGDTATHRRENPQIENPQEKDQLNSLARSAENPAENGRAERAQQREVEREAMKRDPLYGAFVRNLSFEPETRQMWDEWRVGINELNRLHATPQDISRAVNAFYSRFPKATCSVRAIVKWWSALREGKSHDIAKLEASQRVSQIHEAEARARADADREAARLEREQLERDIANGLL